MRRSILALALAGSAQAFSFAPTTHAPALRTSAPAISSKGAHMAGCACTSCRALHTRRVGASRLSMSTVTEDRERTEANALGSNPKDYANTLNELFPGTVDEATFIEAMSRVVMEKGFNPKTAINLVSTCRDEICRPFAEKLDGLWGESFNIASLGGMVFCGKTGFGAGMAHSPQEAGKERYVFWAGPHIAVGSDGPVGKIFRLGRESASSACGALIALQGQIDSGKLDVGLDPTDTEMSLLRQEILGTLSYGQQPNLVGITYAAHDVIVDQVKRTAAMAAPSTSEYVIISGIQVHGALGKNYWWPGSVTLYKDGQEMDLSDDFQKALGSYDVAGWIQSEAKASLQESLGFKGRIDGFFANAV